MLDIRLSNSPSSTTGIRGCGQISGTVKKLGVNISAWLLLFERTSGVLVDKVLANKDGSYFFFNLSVKHSFYIVTKDPSNQYNAVIQDNVVPK